MRAVRVEAARFVPALAPGSPRMLYAWDLELSGEDFWKH